MTLTDYIKLARPQQWYKNLMVFLPIFFVGQFFNAELLKQTIIAFVSLCLVSSSNYVLNDIIDLEKDKAHPEKKNRPLAAGKIKKWQAILEIMLLLFFGLWIASKLGTYFLATAIFLFVFTQVYSVFLKKEIFADLLAIAINFVTRAIAGTFAINVKISPWLVLCPFFLSLYLSAGKRQGDLIFLGEEAKQHKETLKYYTKEITQSLLIISTNLLIMSYSLYSFLSEHKNLLATLPFALYAILRYFYLIQTGSEIARHPEKVFKDFRMDAAMLLWGIVTLGLIYLPKFLR